MKNNTIRLTESAVMLALATVLSVVPLLELPYGGSITLCSAVPLLIIGYRHGTGWGIFTGAVYGLIQMLIGLKNVMYFTTPLSVIAVILLDYLLAFAVLGLGGIFRRFSKAQAPALSASALLCCVLRYILHTIAGCTVWAGLSIPTAGALVYSLAYNATYMIPETIITVLGALLLARMLEFRKETVTRTVTEHGRFDWLAAGAGVAVVAALIYDVREVFSHLQDPETGDFLITGLANASWGAIGIVTAIAAVIAGILLLIRRRQKA